MDTPTKTTNIPSVSALDEVLGNVTIDGVERTRRQPLVSLAAQLAGTGAIAEAITGAAAGNVLAETWTALSEVAPTRNGQPATVPDTDTGYHPDPVAGGTVPNQGTYRGSLAPLGWRRVSDYVDVSSKLNNSSASGRILGRKTSGTGEVEQLSAVRGVSIDVDGLGLADMPEGTFKGRVAGAGIGTPTDMTTAQARAALGLNNVDDTADINKPVSTAQQAAIDGVQGSVSELSVYVADFGITPTEIVDWAYAFIRDPVGNIPVGGFLRDGTFVSPATNVGGTVSEGDSGAWDHAIVGPSGKPMGGFRDGDQFLGYAGKSSDIAALMREGELLAHSASMFVPSNASYARPSWDYNVTLGYGQSLEVGQQAWSEWVANDVATRPDTFMVGSSVRPQQVEAATWVPYTGASLTPLKATVEDGAGYIYTPAEVAALASDSQALGYNPLVGAVRYAARAFEDTHLNTRNWIAVSAGVGGKTVEELSPGASPNEFYDRIPEALAAIDTAVTAVGGLPSHGVVAVNIMQGENNYASLGGNRSKDGYKTLLSDLLDDLDTSIASSTGQVRKPVKLTYQTGGVYTEDDTPTPLSIGMAQWELSLERDDVIMVGPVYQFPDKGGHFTADGSAAYGQQVGKVLHRVVTLGQRWEPLSPLWTDVKGRTVYIGYHVPEPPIVLDLPYVVTTATDFRDKGFRVKDDLGFIPVDEVRVIGSAIVGIDLARASVGTLMVWYGGKTGFNGGGCVRDSDATIADALYQSSDIPALTGNPYPLHNWSIAFWLPVGWSR